VRNVALGAGRIDLRAWREPSGACRSEVLGDSSGLRLLGPGLDESAPDPAIRAFIESMP
jgi:hypothetical protein